MKSLRKSILTLLALTLFGGAGAWAQGQLLTTINASSGFTNGTQTFDNIVTVTLDDVFYDANDGWYRSGSPAPVEVAPVNGVTVTGYMLYFSATDPMEFEGSSFTVALEGYRVLADDISTQLGSVGITKIEVYGPAAQEIELTKEGANQWTLGQTPDYDLELQVEYYEAHALKNIDTTLWRIQVEGVDKTSLVVGDSLLITETDNVTLVPAGNARRVKSVTLEDEAPAVQTFDIDGINLQIAEGDTWADIIARNPGVIRDFNGFVVSDEGMLYDGTGDMDMVHTSAPYDPAQQSDYQWLQ